MALPENPFKQGILARREQIGLWSALCDPYIAEICAGAGFDWMLIDAEHSPNDLRTILGQLQAMAPYPTQPVVRPRIGDVPLIKQILELGVQNLLIPLVESAEQADLMARAMRYPPVGVRGVGSALARSSRWNRIPDYLATADEQMCLLVQVETRRGLDNIDAIAAVPGVDGVFIGPKDLSAAIGFLGDTTHPEVQETIRQSAERIRAAGKAAGILADNPDLARRYLSWGFSFVAVGSDAGLLARGAENLAKVFKGAPRS